MTRRISIYVLAWSLTAVSFAPVRAADEPLPRDDHNIYGQFENGFRYIIRSHDNPPGRISLYLHVKSGAINESEKQNGLAHFMEHMAFNGSKHFAPGELVPFLNRMGMQFGADTNAHTNHQETVFKLSMPDTRPETIEKAMTIFEDDANALLLKPEEIESERKVILEEQRSGFSAGERLQKEMLRKVFEGTRIAVHDIIGDEEQIKHFPREEFLDYWNTWYRPENMTLIVVGDIKPDDIIEMAKKHFATFKARVPAREPLKAGIQPNDATRAFVLTDEEQVGGRIDMMAIHAARPPMKTFKDYRLSEIENIGCWIVNRRLRDRVQKGDAAFRFARAGVSDLLHETIMPSAVAVGEPEDWSKMLQQVIHEVSRAISHGFTEKELGLAKSELISSGERAVETEPTVDSRRIVAEISSEVGEDAPILSAAQELALLKRVLAEASLDEIHDVFVSHFKSKGYTYVLYMPQEKEGLTLPTSDQVLASASEAWAAKTEAPESEKAADSLLAAAPKPGKVISKKTDDDLKITTATFDNGVVMHHRFMDYKKDTVMVSIDLPGGHIEENADNGGISDVASLILRRPATSRLNSTQIDDYLTGKNIRVGGNIGLDTLSINLSGSPRDLDSGMELVYALLTDGKLEKSAFDNWKKNQLQRLKAEKTMPQGQMRVAMEETIFANDPRLIEFTPEQVEKMDPAKAEAWFKRIASNAAIEVTVIGDLSLDDAIKTVGTYIGSLPKRSTGFSDLDSLRKLKRGEGPFAKTIHYKSVTPKAIAFAGFVSCEERDVVDRRVLALASRVLSDRMIKRIREDEQLVYSIGCQNQPGRGLPGLGMMIAGSMADPQNGEKLADTVIEMMKAFADKGLTDEELATAKKQMATMLDTQMKEPAFWLGQISEMAYRNRPLAELKQLPDVYQTFTANQLQDTVKKYLKDDRIIRIVVIPEGDSAEKPASGGKSKGKNRQPTARDPKEGAAGR